MLVKKVKFVGSKTNYRHLTINAVYDVIKYTPSEKEFWDSVTIMGYEGEEHYHYMYDGDDRPVFINVTHEYRNEIINEILR